MARSKTPTPQLIQQPGVADYFNSRPLKTHSILIALAADILILARCEGAPATARYYSQRLNTPVTEKMIKSIKAKAANGQLAITRKELETAALAHPVSAIRMKREPSLCDPKHYRGTPVGKPVPAKPRKKTQQKTPSRLLENPSSTQPMGCANRNAAPEPAVCHPPAQENSNLVADFYNSAFASRPSTPRGILEPYAAEVVLLARMSSIRLATEFFSQKLGRKISFRPVEDILSKFRHGKIIITPEQFAAAAGQHPYAQQYLAANPEIMKPIGYRKS